MRLRFQTEASSHLPHSDVNSATAPAEQGGAAQRTGGSAAPKSADRQRWGTAPAARTVPGIDWNELSGASCNRLLDGVRASPTREPHAGPGRSNRLGWWRGVHAEVKRRFAVAASDCLPFDPKRAIAGDWYLSW